MKSLSLNLLSSQRQSWIYPPASTPSMLSHISPAPVKNVKGTRNETLLPGFQEALCMLEAKCRAATAVLVSGRWNGKEIHAYLKKKSPPKTKVPEPSPLRSPPGKPCVPCPVECSMRCPFRHGSSWLAGEKGHERQWSINEQATLVRALVSEGGSGEEARLLHPTPREQQ